MLKYTPHLVFHLDKSIERGTRVFQILQEIDPLVDENSDDEESDDALAR